MFFLRKVKKTNEQIRVYAHRFSYEYFVGPIPHNKEIDHICRVRHCVNPAHLRTVSHRENVLLGESFGAIHTSRTHCPTGHPYDKENTHYRPNGDRQCKACWTTQHRKQREKRLKHSQ